MTYEPQMVYHSYLSTACHHDLHHNCRQTCKFCKIPCECLCHVDGAKPVVYFCPITGRVDEGVVATAACCTDQCQHVTAKAVAQIVVEELGNWMLSEIGDGLRDAVSDEWPPFRDLTPDDQDRMFAAVEHEIWA